MTDTASLVRLRSAVQSCPAAPSFLRGVGQRSSHSPPEVSENESETPPSKVGKSGGLVPQGFTHPSISEEGHKAWFKPCWGYVIASGNDDRPVKIGVSRDVAARIKALEAGNPHGLRAVSLHPISVAMSRQVERRLHLLFQRAALGREWFEISAEEAAAPIPELCRQAEEALNGYRDAIEQDAALASEADRLADRRRKIREAREQALLIVASRKRKRREEYHLERDAASSFGLGNG